MKSDNKFMLIDSLLGFWLAATFISFLRENENVATFSFLVTVVLIMLRFLNRADKKLESAQSKLESETFKEKSLPQDLINLELELIKKVLAETSPSGEPKSDEEIEEIYKKIKNSN